MLRKVFEASPSFLHVLRGPNFVFEYANDVYYRLVGRRDLLGRPAFEAMPEAAGDFPALIAGVMATRKPFHGYELPVKLARTWGAEPEDRLIDLVYLPLIDPDGRCTRVLGHGTDVTDNVLLRRQAKEAERLSHERLTDALSAGRMIAWEWNVQTDALTSRGAWLELFNRKERLFTTGAGVQAFLHPDDRSARAVAVRAAVAAETSWHLQYRALHPDGGTVWIEERAAWSRDPTTGHPIVTGLAWDISDRKKAEEELHLADRRKNDFIATLSALSYSFLSRYTRPSADQASRRDQARLMLRNTRPSAVVKSKWTGQLKLSMKRRSSPTNWLRSVPDPEICWSGTSTSQVERSSDRPKSLRNHPRGRPKASPTIVSVCTFSRSTSSHTRSGRNERPGMITTLPP